MRAISKRAKINKTINVPSVSSLAPALALDAAALAGDRRRETEGGRQPTTVGGEQPSREQPGKCDKCLSEDMKFMLNG